MLTSIKRPKYIRVFITYLISTMLLGPMLTGSAYAHNTNSTYSQDHFWFRDDDGGEPCDSLPSCTTGATGFSSPDTAQDTSVSSITVGTAFRLRMALVKNNPGDLQLTTTPLLEYKAGGTTGDCTTDTWTPVPTASSCGSSPICQASSGFVSDGTATTILLSALADKGGDIVTGDGSPNISDTFTTSNGSDTAEWEWMLDTDNAVATTVYTLRLSKGTTNTPYNGYSVCPTFTAAAPAATSYTQEDFEWFVTADSVTLTNVWPSGGGSDLAENTALTQIPAKNEPLSVGDRVRLQMSFAVSSAALSASSQAFQLEYDTAEDCTVASGWQTVGGKADTGKAWRLFDETSIGDSTTQVNNISTSTSTAEGYYSEINPSAVNPNDVQIGEFSEWDWPIENYSATANTSYCFRMALSGGTGLNSYQSDSYPRLVTAPSASNLLRHGNIFQNNSEKGFFWAN